MKYKNAKDIFPPDLLRQIQTYIQGEQIYIPQLENIRTNWGEKSGSRLEITFRNKEILQKYNEGMRAEELEELFCLSNESIRKIIYKNNKEKMGGAEDGKEISR